MKRLALVLVLMACAPAVQGPVDWSQNLGTDAEYVIRSQHWNTATVRIWCRTDNRVRVRGINMGRAERGTFDVTTCDKWHFTVETLATRDGRQSFGPFTVQPGDQLRITIAAQLRFTSFMIHE